MMLSRHWKQACLVTALTAIPYLCPAQQKPSVIPLVPAANWRQVDSQPLPLPEVSKFGGDVAIEQEYGVKTLELRTYQLDKVHTQVLVEPAQDATCAYGLLLFYRPASMEQEKGMDLAFGDAGGALMARGNKLIRFVRGNDPQLSQNDFQALLVFVGGTKLSPNALTNLPTPLPAKNLVAGSEKYLLGLEAAKRVLPSFRTELLGFEQGAEVHVGEYQTAHGVSTLLSISYPTPQISRVRFGSMKSFLGIDQDRGADSVYGRRQRSYVFLVLNAGNSGAANLLLDQFKVAEGVSWNERYITERSFTLQLVQMILAILLLTAFLIAACLVAGIIFYVSRRFMRRFFPDSQWGRTDDDQLIRLDLKY